MGLVRTKLAIRTFSVGLLSGDSGNEIFLIYRILQLTCHYVGSNVGRYQTLLPSLLSVIKIFIIMVLLISIYHRDSLRPWPL